jgi:glycosyltransferase involved in cell wall biosynthesis
MTFVEALAAGLPVITTRLGAAPEIVTPECGALVSPGDRESLRDALRTFLARTFDHDVLAAHARARADQLCNAGRQLRRLATLLESVKAA